MTNEQISKLKMYSAVISFCNQNTAITASIPALQSAFNLFNDTVTSIDNASQHEDYAISGITADKNLLRQNLMRLTASVILKVSAYADEINDNELKARVNFTVSDLLRLKDKELPGKCRGIVAVVNANLPGLAQYTITAAFITELNLAIDQYAAAIPRPRTATSERSTNVKTLRALFIKANTILKNRMDKIVATLDVVNLPFYQSYLSNRGVVGPSTTPTQVKGTITNKNNGELLSDVVITVTDSVVTATSGKDGKYGLKPLPAGTYSIHITKPGFLPVTIDGQLVKLGKILTVNAALVVSTTE